MMTLSLVRRMLVCLAVGICCLLNAHPASAGDDPDAVIAKLQKKYDSIRDASVSFTETVRFGVTQSEQSFSGKFSMKRGNKYRIDLGHENIVTDGLTVWSYSKINNQVLIDKYKEDPKSFSPDKVLVNVPANYQASAMGKDTVQRFETIAIKLIPKDEKSNVKWIKVWVDEDEWLMRRMQYLDVSDNLTTYEITDIRLNLALRDNQFQFEPPKDAEVIDLR
jgi:chaperone LolA